MSKSRKNHSIFYLIVLFIAIAGIVFLGLAVAKKLSKPKGVVSYDASLSAEERAFLEEAFSDFVPEKDVTISGTYEPASSLDSLDSKNSLVYQTEVPVTDFHAEALDVSSSDVIRQAQTMPQAEQTGQAQTTTQSQPEGATNITLIPVSQLSPGFKLLSLDGKYYLDDFKNGAIYRILHFNSENPSETLTKVADKITRNDLTKDNVLTFNQTGVTALTRAMLKTLNAVGDGAYFAEYVKDYLSSSDLTHISNEVSFASDCNASADMTLCADPRMFSAITAIGTDIVELTGNHNNDWGKTANLETIKLYHDNNIQTFGGGETEEAAVKPLEITEKGNNITLIGINYSTSSKENGQGATGNNPGANIYNEAITKAQIKEAKDKGNFVIVDVQFSECYSYPDFGEEMPECDAPINGQQEFFRNLIDQGADMVVGTQAHQPQTYELYHEKPIYYGLGNLFFDQTRWPGTERSLILTHYFKDGKLLQTRIIPTMYGTTYQPQILENEAKAAYLTRLLSASPKGN